MNKIILDSVVIDIINDFIETSNYFGYYPKIVEVTNNPLSVNPFRLVFNLCGIPSHQLLRSLSLRFNQVIVKVQDETDVLVEVFDNALPF